MATELTAQRFAGMRRPHPIRWLREHPDKADLLLALMLTTSAAVIHVADVADIAADDVDYIDPAWWTVPFVVAAVFPIAWRRSRPIPVAIFVVAVEVTVNLIGITGTGFIGVVVALYSLGAHASGRSRTQAVIAISIVLSLLFVAGLVVAELDVGEFVSTTVVLITFFVLGDNLRRRREAAAALEERAERAERERELIAQQRVTAERSRIARELHDVVAHSVSVMVIQAAAARRSLTTSPANAEQALTNIEHTGRQTMNELRGILGVLRRSDGVAHGGRKSVGTFAPQPTLADLCSLIEVSDDLPVTLTVDGDVADLAESVTLTGYRVVQEAFTNIRGHAGPVNAVDVTVRRSDGLVLIGVTDDGRGSAADPEETPGYGIVGMRERIAAVGGSLDIGARTGGGWRVQARLPTTPTGPVAIETTTRQPASNGSDWAPRTDEHLENARR